MSHVAIEMSAQLSRMPFHLLSFEGPDEYARAGGIASRINGEGGKRADYASSLPPFLLHEALLPHLRICEPILGSA